MVVAVTPVRMVQLTLDEVVDVITVRHRFVTTVGSVLVPDVVRRSPLTGRAAVGVLVIDRDSVLIDVILVGMVQMSVVEKVGMPIVADGDMTAVRSVLVIVAGVDGVIAPRHPGSFARVTSNHARPDFPGGLIAGHENRSHRRQSDAEDALESAMDGSRA